MSGPTRARRALQVVVFAALWGLLTHGTHAGTGDEPHYLAIAHSLAFDGDLDLGNNYGAAEPLVGAGTLQPETHVRPGVGGIARPVHDVGLPALFAPFVRLAVPLTNTVVAIVPAPALARARLNPPLLYRHLLSLAMACLAALLAGALYETFIALGGSTRTAFAMALLLALSPPLLIFSILFFTELLSALLAFLVFRHVTMIDVRGAGRWTLLGLATGFLFLLHARNVGLMLPLVALTLPMLRDPARRRDWAAFTLALVAMVATRTAINYLFWGTLLAGPHARAGEWTGLVATLAEMLMRAAALLVDQEFGLLPYAPIYLLAAAGAVVLFRERPALARAICLVGGVYVAFILFPLTNAHGWMGGWNPAARFLTPIVPLLGVMVFASIRAVPRPVLAAVVALQIAISAYTWQHPKVLWNNGTGRAAICDTIGDGACRYLPSFVQPQGT
jgi:hypothetical protein